MRISASSGRDHRYLAVALAMVAALGGLAAAAPPRPDNPAPRTAAPPGDARTAVGGAGGDAMDRLDAALARRRAAPEALPQPGPFPALPETMRRRAFDGLARHPVSPEMTARARAAHEAGQAGFAAERDAVAKRIAQALGLEAPALTGAADAVAPAATDSRVPVLFVSAAMPVAILRTYAGQLALTGGVLAFRGMPGGLSRVAPMAKLAAEILRLDPGCEGPACAMRDVQLIVDPLLFSQHGVTRVPALAMIPGDPVRPYCEREADAPRRAHLVYGDAALSGLLAEYARLGGQREVRDAQSRLASR